MARINIGTGGSVGLTSLIGSIVAFCTTPQFVGWAGAGKSLLVGAGTAIGGGLLALGGVVTGGAVGYLTGKFIEAVSAGKLKNVGKVMGIGGLVLGGVPGFAVGVYEGYTTSKNWLTNKNEICAPADQKTSFNYEVPTQTIKLNANKNLSFTPKMG